MFQRRLKIVDRGQAPSYSLRDYPYIQRGFISPGYSSLFDALDTFVRPNNETTNVYTQLAGLLLFVWAFGVTITEYAGVAFPADTSGSRHTPVDPAAAAEASGLRAIALCLLADIVVCIFSTSCHMWQARNKTYHAILSVLDWGGTVIAALTSCAVIDFWPPETNAGRSNHWNNFRDEALSGYLGIDSRNVQESSVFHFGSAVFVASPAHFCAVLCALVFLLVLFAVGRTNHTVRFGSVFIVAFYVGIPLLPYFVATGANARLVSGVAGFLVGGAFFGSHAPEKVVPSKFDIVLSSHTLWHCGYLFGLYQLHSCMALAYVRRVPWEPQAVTDCVVSMMAMLGL